MLVNNNLQSVFFIDILSQVTKYSQDYNDIFFALADPTRRDILERLTSGNLTVGQIASSYKFALPTISKHLVVLEKAKLVERNKVGRENWITFNSYKLMTAVEYFEFYKKFWSKKIAKLEDFLAEK